MKPRIPASPRRVLETVLDTFEKLEVAAQLAARGPVCLTELADRAQVSVEAANEVAVALVDVGVVEIVNASDTLLQLGSRAQRADFAELMHLYETDRVSVLSELCTLSIERIRGMAARTFAEAFVFKRKHRS